MFHEIDIKLAFEAISTLGSFRAFIFSNLVRIFDGNPLTLGGWVECVRWEGKKKTEKKSSKNQPYIHSIRKQHEISKKLVMQSKP